MRREGKTKVSAGDMGETNVAAKGVQMFYKSFVFLG